MFELVLFLGGMIGSAALVLWWSLRERPCRHEFTYWAPREQWTGPGKQWWRRCTKCEVGEVRHSETEPKN
jgi:hypothetical protein